MGDEAVHRGLDGVVSDTTSISMVNAATNSLTYRGYAVQELAASCSFEEVAYLIWHGELPSASELDTFTAAERARREVPAAVFDMVQALPLEAHPMDSLRLAVSALGAFDSDEADRAEQHNLEAALSLMAKLPGIVALDRRRRRSESPIPPRADLGFAANFFHMCFGEVPEPAVVKAFEISLILYAEHSFNASTFTARVITSTLSDLYSAVTGAIGALKGPLHGGANEAVMAMLEEIDDPERAEHWLDNALSNKQLIMGFGHRVYKNGDSRVPTMRRALEDLAQLKAADRLMALYQNLEAAMMRAKHIHPNLDYPTGPAYHLMGFETELFTPIFVMSRITGWTAHIIEQLQHNSLIRPLSKYVGLPERSVPATRR